MRFRKWMSTGVMAALACFATAQQSTAESFSLPLRGAPASQSRSLFTPVSLENGDAAGTDYTTCNPCQSCFEDCAPCCAPCAMLIGGAEASFLFPTFHGAGGQTLLTDGVAPITGSSTGNNDINGRLIVAPRVWLGVQGERWGLVGRYWNAQSWRSGFSPADPTLGPGVSASNNFGAYLADLEVQRRVLIGQTNLYGLVGVRYGSLRMGQGLSSSAFVGNDFLSAQTRSSQSFNGTGITFGFWGTRNIGDSPFALFFSNRYSFLFGTGSAGVQTSATVLDPVGSATGVNSAFAKGNNGDLFIAEFQVGGQWQRQLAWFRGTAFIRTAFEFQYWDSSENVFATASTVSFVGPNVAAASATSGDFFFNMVGVTLGAGIMY